MTPKERAITFSGEDVRAILEGRLMSFQKPIFKDGEPEHHMVWLAAGTHWQDGDERLRCPWKIGGRLWVREAWVKGYQADDSGYLVTTDADGDDLEETVWYRATEGDFQWWKDGERTDRVPWKSPAVMPRWASRITLEIISVRAQRLPDWKWVVGFRRVESDA